MNYAIVKQYYCFSILMYFFESLMTSRYLFIATGLGLVIKIQLNAVIL